MADRGFWRWLSRYMTLVPSLGMLLAHYARQIRSAASIRLFECARQADFVSGDHDGPLSGKDDPKILCPFQKFVRTVRLGRYGAPHRLRPGGIIGEARDHVYVQLRDHIPKCADIDLMGLNE